MNRDQVDAFLAEADDVIDDWEGSIDSATWSVDGSHETEISGDYYADDHPCDCSYCSAERALLTHLARAAEPPSIAVVNASFEVALHFQAVTSQPGSLPAVLVGDSTMRFELLCPLTEANAAALDAAERLLGHELEPWQRNVFLRAMAVQR